MHICTHIRVYTYICTHTYTYIYIWWGGGAPEISANLSKGGTYLAMYLVERVLTLCYLDCPNCTGCRNKQDGLGLGKISRSTLTPSCSLSDTNTASPPAGAAQRGWHVPWALRAGARQHLSWGLLPLSHSFLCLREDKEATGEVGMRPLLPNGL